MTPCVPRLREAKPVKLAGIIFAVMAVVDAAIWTATRSAARACADAAALAPSGCDAVVRDIHAVLGPFAVVDALVAAGLLLAIRRDRGRLPPCPLCGHPGGAHHCSGPPLRPR
jgi:hypothetical protein